MNNLFYNAEGGTVVIELMPYNEGNNNYASAYEQVIEFISSLIRKYANNVLTVIVEITKMQGVSKKLVSRVADDIDIISISEGCGSAGAAKKYMEYLVKNSALSDYNTDNIVFEKSLLNSPAI